ncbi:hypothetical protein GA0115255_114126, partial [Streptomyces sp. Ncost-T6T-2b]
MVTFCSRIEGIERLQHQARAQQAQARTAVAGQGQQAVARDERLRVVLRAQQRRQAFQQPVRAGAHAAAAIRSPRAAIRSVP